MASEDVAEQCSVLQEDEITVLDSIYPSLLQLQPNPQNRPGRILNLTIPITLPSPIPTVLSTVAEPSSSASSSSLSVLPTIELTHLPQITLRLSLPAAYPLYEPPRIISLRAPITSHDDQRVQWLSRNNLSCVQGRMKEMWDEERDLLGEGAGVLWKWWEWVGSGEFMVDLGLIKDGQLEMSVPPMIPPSTFHTMLKTYNAQQLHSSFAGTAYSCSICLENRKGKSCIQMPGCGCVFCTPCLSSCWSLAIEEGTLENVSCPSVGCVKQRATRDPRAAQGDQGKLETDATLVGSVVGSELRVRWEELKERRKAEIDPSYTICPLPSCQAAVPPPSIPTSSDPAPTQKDNKRVIRLADIQSNPSSPPPLNFLPTNQPPAPPAQSEDRWARFRTCPKCKYHFCLYCSNTWHGAHTPCAFPQTSLIVQEYLSYPVGSEGRLRMESQKGKGNLERMVGKYLEEVENKRWLMERTRACSGCGVRVEKSHGCNHMTCGRCNAHFCYRCGDSISPQDPYAHYRRPGHACFEKLFDQEEIARFERETAMGVGAGMEMMEGEEMEFREIRGFWEW